jgi:hypothetical protein
MAGTFDCPPAELVRPMSSIGTIIMGIIIIIGFMFARPPDVTMINPTNPTIITIMISGSMRCRMGRFSSESRERTSGRLTVSPFSGLVPAGRGVIGMVPIVSSPLPCFGLSTSIRWWSSVDLGCWWSWGLRHLRGDVGVNDPRCVR